MTSQDGPSQPADEITVRRPEPGRAVVVFRGEHDLSERDEVEQLLMSLIEAGEHVTLDFSEATFVDSTIVHVLLLADVSARQRGRRLALHLGDSSIVARVFELTGVSDRLEPAAAPEAHGTPS